MKSTVLMSAGSVADSGDPAGTNSIEAALVQAGLTPKAGGESILLAILAIAAIITAIVIASGSGNDDNPISA